MSAPISTNTTTRDSWTNEGANITSDAIGTNTTGAVDVLIGARRQTAPSTGFGFPLTGSIAEIAMYDSEVNEAQRIIITNYLAAKYAITLTANDVYTEDDSGYDFEVIGIGQASDGTNHLDSRGPGVTRIWNSDDLDNSEYLMVGHDNTVITSTTTGDVDGTIIEERLTRVWGASKLNDLGTVSVSIDFNPVGGNPLGSNLRLLIDRDGDGFADNDVTPIPGSVSNDIAVFSNVNFMDGDLFTLGNADITQALPIELISFSAEPVGDAVVIDWTTGSELNNDFFTIERSQNALQWTDLEYVSGAGTSNEELSYQVIDDDPIVGTSYYRLKQTDYDGKFSYSKIAFVQFDYTSNKFTVVPNPSSDFFYVQTPEEIEFHQVSIFDNAGHIIAGRVNLNRSGITVDLTGLPEGIYLLKIVESQGLTSVTRLIKN